MFKIKLKIRTATLGTYEGFVLGEDTKDNLYLVLDQVFSSNLKTITLKGIGNSEELTFFHQSVLSNSVISAEIVPA